MSNAPKCGAKKRQGGDPCGQVAGWKTDHPGVGRCALHGGASPSGNMAAARQQLDAEVRLVLTAEGVKPVSDPVAALQALAGEAVAAKDLLAAKCEELRELVVVDANGTEEVRALIRAYERALDRASRLLVAMVRLDLDARLVRLDEIQGALLIRVVEAVLDGPELNLDAAGRRTGRDVLARELALVSGAG